MAFSLFNWFTSDNNKNQPDNLITAPTKIAALLQHLIDDRVLLTIKISGCGETFSSTIIEIQKKDGVFLLDELIPKIGHDLLMSTKTLSIQGHGDGPSLSFIATLQETGNSTAAIHYQMYFPTSIKRREKRANFRARVYPAKQVNVTFYHKNKVLYGYIYDISAVGIGLIAESAGVVQRGDDFELCRITLNKDETITVNLSVRRILKLSNNQTRIGCVFTNLNQKSKKLISKFVNTIERDNLNRRKKSS